MTVGEACARITAIGWPNSRHYPGKPTPWPSCCSLEFGTPKCDKTPQGARSLSFHIRSVPQHHHKHIFSLCKYTINYGLSDVLLTIIYFEVSSPDIDSHMDALKDYEDEPISGPPCIPAVTFGQLYTAWASERKLRINPDHLRIQDGYVSLAALHACVLKVGMGMSAKVCLSQCPFAASQHTI